MSPAPLMPPPLAPRAADAVEALHSAIEALPPYAVPCVADGSPRDWLTDDPAAIERAVEACSTCPVLALCEAFGIAIRADGVVLAGRRWTPHTAKNLRTRTSSATAVEDHERQTS